MALTGAGRSLQRLVDGLVNSGEVSAAAAGIARGDRRLVATAGRLDPDAPAGGAAEITQDTFFDLASVTKLHTVTVALELDEKGRLRLSDRVGEHLPRVPDPMAKLPLESLLRHRAGLIPWYPFYTDPTQALNGDRFLDPALWSRPAGSQVYSDLGPILWGLLAAETGCAGSEGPEGVGAAGFTRRPPAERTAGTRLSNSREVELAAGLGIAVEEETVARRGTPQDGNARWIPGAGHAGLFGTLRGVMAFGHAWLDPEGVGRQRERALAGSGRHRLGWWAADSGREGLRSSAFGHNGFTGCSLWLEPDNGRVMALLAHRRTRSDTLERTRRDFHGLASTLDP